MKFAAFLCNVNLGRSGAPTKAQLEQAFAGAERVLRKALKLMAAPGKLPLDNLKGDVRLLALKDGNALSVCWKRGASPGSPNLFLERSTGVMWTTRAIGPVRRLLAKHAA